MFNFKKRISAIRDTIEKNDLDAFVTAFLPHVRYLTGFSGSNGLCVVTRSEVFFLTDFRYQQQIKAEVKGCKSFVVSGSLIEAAMKKNIFRRLKWIGFEREHLLYSSFSELKESLKSGRCVPVADVVEAVASVKDEEEISLIKHAAEITDNVCSEILSVLKPGIPEGDIGAEISYLHRKHGAEGDSFETIVVSGERGALPHGHPSTKKIKKGEMITLDFGCVYGGYCSDLTRTIALGNPTAELKKIYSIVLDAQRKALDEARSGITARALDSAARSYITSKGYGKYFGHGLGHGVGLQIHEPPKISAASTHTMQNGNVVTIEPGIYIPGTGGVRIEDDILIRENGCEVITSSPKELIVL
jgi:Xaa-Pro aminopeptidase